MWYKLYNGYNTRLSVEICRDSIRASVINNERFMNTMKQWKRFQAYQALSRQKVAFFRRMRGIVTIMTVVVALLCASLIPLPAANANPIEDKNHFALGIRAYQAHHYPLALSYFKDAAVWQPKHPQLLYYLGNTHYKLGHFLDAADAFQRVMAVAPPTSDAYRYALRGLIRLQSPDLFETKAGLAQRLSKGGTTNPNDYFYLTWDKDNYIDQILYNNKRLRWSTTEGPLKVYVNQHPQGIQNFQPAYVQQARTGLSQWMKALDNQLSVVYVPQPTSAQIRVEWVNQLDKTGFSAKNATTFHAGLTTPQVSNGQLHRMRVKIATLGVDGKPQGKGMMQTIITHELGHALGLMGHSTDSRDLMHSRSRPNSSLTSRDKATLRQLYGEVASITHAKPVISADDGEIAGQLTGEELDNLDQQIHKDEANVAREGNYLNYLNLGTAYFNKGKYLKSVQNTGKNTDKTPTELPTVWFKKGLQAIEKAVTLQPSSALALATRSTVLRELGMYPKALSDIEQAIQLDSHHGEYYRERANILSWMGRSSEAKNALNDYLLREPYEANSSVVMQIKARL